MKETFMMCDVSRLRLQHAIHVTVEYSFLFPLVEEL